MAGPVWFAPAVVAQTPTGAAAAELKACWQTRIPSFEHPGC
jgi:hypothetical protein